MAKKTIKEFVEIKHEKITITILFSFEFDIFSFSLLSVMIADFKCRRSYSHSETQSCAFKNVLSVKSDKTYIVNGALYKRIIVYMCKTLKKISHTI